MIRSLFKADNLDDLVEGRTNVPLALHNGDVSEDALIKISQQLEGTGDYDLGYNLGYITRNVLRVDAGSGKIHYVAVRNFGVLNNVSDYHYYQFAAADGSLSLKENGYSFNLNDLFFSCITVGLYALIRWQLPSVKMNARQHDKLSALYTQLIIANTGDASRFAESIPVYLESAQDVQALTGRTAKPVHMKTPAQFVSGGSQLAVQIAASFLGATAVISYQQASPAKGTPVILE